MAWSKAARDAAAASRKAKAHGAQTHQDAVKAAAARLKPGHNVEWDSGYVTGKGIVTSKPHKHQGVSKVGVWVSKTNVGAKGGTSRVPVSSITKATPPKRGK